MSGAHRCARSSPGSVTICSHLVPDALATGIHKHPIQATAADDKRFVLRFLHVAPVR